MSTLDFLWACVPAGRLAGDVPGLELVTQPLEEGGLPRDLRARARKLLLGLRLQAGLVLLGQGLPEGVHLVERGAEALDHVGRRRGRGGTGVRYGGELALELRDRPGRRFRLPLPPGEIERERIQLRAQAPILGDERRVLARWRGGLRQALRSVDHGSLVEGAYKLAHDLIATGDLGLEVANGAGAFTKGLLEVGELLRMALARACDVGLY
ncbi:MAG TPA: hypothetical protein VKU41_15050, partial [Polyangiaceae bacterium]|nr:hypothetical protein [Polyangiaceae bacterium]